MRTCRCVIIFPLLALTATVSQTTSVPRSPSPTATAQPSTPSQAAEDAESAASTSAPHEKIDQMVDRVIEREHALMEMLKTRTPIIETYLQDLKFDPQTGPTPVRDHYFLGRMDLGQNVDRRDYLQKQSFEHRLLGGFTKLYKLEYKPMGFSWMIFVDRNDFNRRTYDFEYARREFLGAVRCIVFNVTPKKGTGSGRFHGQIWVEDQDDNIVRFNGTYEPRPRLGSFFHLDSWRLNLVPSYWLPTYVYSEEGDFSYGSKDKTAFKAQTRVWGYDLQKDVKDSEHTEVLLDSTVKDETPAVQDVSPLQAQRDWVQQAEEKVIDRLQNAGLLAPQGELDKVLETVINNLLITNNIDLPRPVRARLMLTTPLESFSVGNTIVMSRGLVDVLPDEASLAMVLAHELAHIVLGHTLGSKYAFSDRLLFSDESTYQNLGFRHVPQEEAAADKKAVDLLKNSPYSQKLGTAGLFLRELAERGHVLPGLLTPHLGNSFTDDKGKVTRMATLMNAAPALARDNLDQIAALPLGGRVKLNPWDDHAELIKSTPVAIISARDKMPLEVTPFSPRLTRQGATVAPSVSAAKTSN